jgi:nitrite reductase/ring-hydroxylating ferredoxin subunit
MTSQSTGREERLADVGSVADFPNATPRIVTANNRELAVYRWGDRFIAVRNRCAHMGMSFLRGTVVERVESGGTRRERRATSEPELVCPVHGYSYDAAGQCVTHARMRVRSYPVQVRDGRVLVNMAPGAAREPNPTGQKVGAR